MSFAGPVPPDPKTLPPPIDDPFFNTVKRAQLALNGPFAWGPEPQATFAAPSEPQYYDSYRMEHVEPPAVYTDHGYVQPVNRWSPSESYLPLGYRAPVLQPRYIQQPNQGVDYCDPYFYAMEPLSVPFTNPVIDKPDKETINAAVAAWYANQVVALLVRPGQYRAGQGGAADDEWGPVGRERDAWTRIGRQPPDYSRPWGRMGMPYSPPAIIHRVQSRSADAELQDPYNLLWGWEDCKPRKANLASFVADMMLRMSMSTTSVIAAVWFLAGLGRHDGDIGKGSALRAVLREPRPEEPEGVERRVAVLGLLLAGKWLDDNSFLTKSW